MITRRTILAAAALSFAASAFASTISDLSFLPGDRAVLPAVANQTPGDIAPGGPGALVVWTDDRTDISFAEGGGSFSAATHEGNQRDIYATRIDAAGNPLDTSPIIVACGEFDQVNPVAAWNGTEWLVVFFTERESYFYDDLVAVRVAVDGTVRDATPIMLRRDRLDSSDPMQHSVASDGRDWLVAWRDNVEIEKQVRATRVFADGTVETPDGKVFATGSTFGPSSTTLGFLGDEYLLGYGDDISAMKVQRLTRTLDKIGGPITITPTGTYHPYSSPRLAVSPGGYFLAWDYYDGSWTRLFATRLSPTGAVLDPSGILVGDYRYGAFYYSAAAWDGENWNVFYMDGGADVGVFARKVSPAGTVLDAGRIVADPPGQQYSSVAAARPGGGSYVAYLSYPADGDSADTGVGGTDASGGVAAYQTVSVGLSRQMRPRAAGYPGGHLIAWWSQTSTDSRVLVQRLGHDGIPLDTEPVEVARGKASEVSRTAVAFDGTQFLVVWGRQSAGIQGRFVGTDGRPAGDAFTVSSRLAWPEVAGMPGTFLVTGRFTYSGDQVDLHGVRVASDGAVLDTSFGLFGNYCVDAAVEAVGDRFLVAVERQSSHDRHQSSVYGRFVSPDRSLTDPFQISDSSGYGDNPDIAYDGVRALVSFTDNFPRFNDRVMGRFVIPGVGNDGPAFVIADQASEQDFARLAFNGTDFIAAWEDDRAKTDLDLGTFRADIYTARITTAGAVQDPAGIPVEVGANPEAFPDVSSTGDGRAVILYDAFPTNPEVERIGYRVLGDAPSCRPDCNKDGRLNVNDFICFQNEWRRRTAYGDYNGDGKWNINDFIAFQVDFTRGCT